MCVQRSRMLVSLRFCGFQKGVLLECGIRFYIAFEDWELVASYSLLQLIQTHISWGDRRDTLYLQLKGDGKFDTRSYYHVIRSVSNSLFPWKGVWKPKIPKRVAFFLWTAVHGRILTLDNLMLKGHPLANRCCMCCCDGESVDHLLLHCPVTHSYGLLCFRPLVFIGLCQDQWLVYYLVGISGLGSIIQTFGTWF